MPSVNPRRKAQSPDSDDQQVPNMSLRKSATFHSPSSPVPQTLEDSFAPPPLSRSETHLEDLVHVGRRRAALTLTDIEETMLQSDKASSASPRASTRLLRNTGASSPRHFFDVPDVGRAASPREQPAARHRSADQDSDSGLGSEISTADGSAANDKAAAAKLAAAAQARSSLGGKAQALPGLGHKSYRRILQNILGPLLGRSDLLDFRSDVLRLQQRIKSKDIVCLRDLERGLICLAPWKSKTATLYLKFCFTSLQCIQATVDHLPDRDQVRPGDRPYSNGYFIDLRDQIVEYSKKLKACRDGAGTVDMDIDPTDELKLYGGMAENGRPAELVRVKKDGTAISLATGQRVESDKSPVQIKRSLSERRVDDEEITRSMARRKKNPSPEELAPRKCREHGCNKEFRRPCDLTKHEKTHSRPWKCPMPDCKYHSLGWPTEKEMARHVNDKHSSSPAYFECEFKPCPYKSKRQSNCKQHMEKAHGWQYVRSKNNGKKLSPNEGSTPQQTPPLGSESDPSVASVYGVPTPPQEPDNLPHTFPMLPADANYNMAYQLPSAAPDAMDLGADNAMSASPYEQYPAYHESPGFILQGDEDLYAAAVQLPDQALPANQFNGALMAQQLPLYAGLQPGPALLSPPQPAQAQFQNPLQPQLGAPVHQAMMKQHINLYSPVSLPDEGYSEPVGREGNDFQLFPNGADEANNNQALMNDFFPHDAQDMLQARPSWDQLGFETFTEPFPQPFLG
ncbi:hypothetical protein CDD83_10396 [Cordyceps sp. RAO-2017]|nr:hypothetical protein CDD83_10396 [Cordyceps sp. RAO-2017]